MVNSHHVRNWRLPARGGHEVGPALADVVQDAGVDRHVPQVSGVRGGLITGLNPRAGYVGQMSVEANTLDHIRKNGPHVVSPAGGQPRKPSQAKPII